MTNPVNRQRLLSLSDLVTALVVGFLISTFMLSRLVDPRSSVGQFVFWPQDYLPFLKFGSDSSVAARFVFVAISAALGTLVWIALRAARFSESGPVRRIVYGIVAIASPMLCWIVTKDGHVVWVGGALTVVYIVAAAWFSVGRWSLHIAAWYTLLVFWSVWWVYIFRRELDPIMLLVPFLSLCSAVVWTYTRHGVTPA